MAANAFKDLSLGRNSPPWSPSRMQMRPQTSLVPTKNKPQYSSKLLATLDAEIPNWLAGPLVPNVASLVNSASIETSAVAGPSKPLARSKEKIKVVLPASKGKSTFNIVLPLSRTRSDIENSPEIAVAGDGGVTADATDPPVELPLYSYKQYRPSPAVVYTQHEDEANDLAYALKGPLGFDLEWVVTFRRGKSPRESRTALVQLCDTHMILLVQVSSMKRFPQKIKELIEDKNIIKTGANIRNDGQKLFRDFGILASNLVELGALARQTDPTFSLTYKRSIVALAKVVARYTHKALDKGRVRTSDWEAKLSQTQITYAANDAHCALMVYKTLMELADANGCEVNLEECAADLAREYRQKTVAAATDSMPGTSVQVDTASQESSVADSPTALKPAPTSSKLNAAMHPLSYVDEIPQVSTSKRDDGLRPQLGTAPRPQHLRAYTFWHKYDMALSDICVNLRSKDNPLAESTVISYVVRALQADPSLPYSMDRLKAFVQLEAGSWTRHRDWILEIDGYKKP